ncbi:MAG: hypothetical protein A2277_08430 [Desulfobacterales bacterium RIFOXYA12_FULL_46_15]|nr:MAG: hypothetical protein A2097_02595 [Desulfobacula sp. GWF2_41_7]OGR25216.1 MAG: hypothetical protein A2277_08430 [Desulfobacterales bacterium RIFOXYA12_FULL_46_15]
MKSPVQEKEKPASSPTAPAVEQAAQLLFCLQKNKGNDMGLTAICKGIGIHKSKGYSILNALAKYDLVTRDNASKTYSLGPALMPLAQKAKEKFDITAIARDHLQELSEATKTSVLLGIICNDQVFITGKYDGNDKVSVTVNLYQSLPITHGSHGKAVFGYLTPEEQERLLFSGQIFFHGNPEDFDADQLKSELIFCREKGYAMDQGKMSPGINAVSSPIFDHNGEAAACIIILGTFQEDRFEVFGKMIAETGRMISRQLGARI